ncbi:hypothetical protein EDD22DRAFT_962067 [Suillus occidentalis]|nr:hypothetical protein EDD22DRAFT_962067 [Suillus occidentalis]
MDGFIGSCCNITQKLADKKESAENERVLDHWQTEHDQLKLYDIDNDEDDEEEGADQVAGASSGGEGVMKQEHADSAPLADELAHFEKRDMLADSEYFDEKVRDINLNLNVLKEYKK